MSRLPLLRQCAIGAIAAVSTVTWMNGPTFAGALYDSAFEARYNDPSNPAALSGFVNVAVDEGQYDQALSTLEQKLFADPNDLRARISLARIYYHVGSFDVALSHVDEALRLGSGTEFQAEVEALKRLIEKAVSGVRSYLDLTVGGRFDQIQSQLTTFGFPGPEYGGSAVAPFAFLDGFVQIDLQTAGRDTLDLFGGVAIDTLFSDGDFDRDFETTYPKSGYVSAVYSKGLPDVVDTLRADLGVYGEIAEETTGRIRREIGVRGRVSVRPTVETALYADFGYGWLGASTDIFIDHQYRYGVGGQFRFAPGWTGEVYVGRQHTTGTAIPAFAFASPLDYDVVQTNVEASLTHLLHVFADGRSWFHELSAGYVDGEILDYGSTEGFGNPILSNLQSWEINWEHTVQVSTSGRVQLGIGYKDTVVDSPAAFSVLKEQGWNAHLRFTHRFE